MAAPTKQSGLGDNFYVAGYDMSLDVASVDTLSGPSATFDVTGIKQAANARLYGQRSGDWQWTAFLDTGSGAQAPWVDNLHTLPRTDVIATYFRGTTILNPAACINGKEIDYAPTRDTTGNLTIKPEIQSNGFGMEWGQMLTAGLRTDGAATTGPALDQGNGFTTPSVPASGTPVLNSSPLPATVVISGGTMTNVQVNGISVGTGAGTYTVPPNGGSIILTYTVAPTWTWTLQTLFGGQAYLQLVAFTGTSVDVQIAGSTTSGGTYTTFVDFGAQTAVGAFRAISSAQTIPEFVKVNTVGTFSNAVFAVMLNRNVIATSF